MVVDMNNMKKSSEEVDKARRMFDKLKYYSVSDDETDAVNEALTASQELVALDKPDPAVEEYATAANQQLSDAVLARRKEEKLGAKQFGEHTPLPDDPDPSLNGPFSQLYKESKFMQESDDKERSMMGALKAKPPPAKVMRELYPKKKDRQRERADDDTYFAHDIDKDSLNPARAKAFVDAAKNTALEEQLMELLHKAASSYRSRKTTEPKLKYAQVVQGTSIEGVTNYFAMSPEELGHATDSFALQAKAATLQENKLDAMQENYLQKFDEDTRMVPFAEWQKQWTLNRMVNEEVHDPDNRVTEKMIRESAAKLMAAHENPDLKKDVADVLKAQRAQDAEHDESVASLVAQAPTPEALEKMHNEGIVGAKQLALDTALADEKLQNETAHPHHYGKDKKVDPGAEPQYAEVDREAELQEGRDLVKKTNKVLLTDAERLANSGSKGDQMVLRADTKAAMKGEPTDNAEMRHNVQSEQLFYDMLEKQYGNQTATDVKKGVRAKFTNEMKKWDKVKKVVTGGGVSPLYGAEALKALPTRSQDLDGDAQIDDVDDDVPARKDDSPDNGNEGMPQESYDEANIKDKEEEIETSGYAVREENTPTDTDEQMAADVAGVESYMMKPDQRDGEEPGSQTENLANQIAGDAQKTTDKVESKSDIETAEKEQTVNHELPNAVSQDSDSPEDKEAANEINAASAGRQSSQDDNGGSDGDNTASGIPIKVVR